MLSSQRSENAHRQKPARVASGEIWGLDGKTDFGNTAQIRSLSERMQDLSGGRPEEVIKKMKDAEMDRLKPEAG